MNWLDILIIIILVIAGFMGFRTGIIGAALTAIGAIIGWLLAGQFSEHAGSLFGDSLSNDTIVTVVSYAIIILVALLVARIVHRIVRPFLSAMTLGMAGLVDRLAGLGLGLLVGVAVSGALILALARLTYNFEELEGGVAGAISERVAQVRDTRQSMENALTASAIVPVFIDFTDALPADALGFVPSDFKTAFDILEEKIE